VRSFLICFRDAYPLYSRAFHSSLGHYVTLGQLPAHLQDLLRNLFPTHCVPPNADLHEAFQSFFSDCKALEEGVYVDLGPEIGLVFLIGGVGLIRCDMPEGSDFCSTLRHTARRGCRHCHTTSQDFHKVLSTLEVTKVTRTFQGARAMRRAAASENYSAAQTIIVLAKMGLRETEGPFLSAGLRTDPFRQTPHDPLHLEKLGFAKKLLSCLFESLTPSAGAELNDRLRKFPRFPTWESNLPVVALTTSKKSGKQTVKLNANAMGRICAVLPLIVRNWLVKSHFSPKFQRSAAVANGEEWLVRVQVAIAMSARSLFKVLETHRQFNEGDVFATGGVTEVVRNARHTCYELWPHRFKNPTQHCGSHHEEATPRISVPRQARCSKGEVKNLQMKRGVVGLNGRFTPEEMMMMAENLRQALLFLCHGGHRHLRGSRFGLGFINTLEGPLIQHILSRSLNTIS